MPPENGDEAALPAFHRRRRFHDKEKMTRRAFSLCPCLSSLPACMESNFERCLHPIIANCIDQHVWYLSIRRRADARQSAGPLSVGMSRPRRAGGRPTPPGGRPRSSRDANGRSSASGSWAATTSPSQTSPLRSNLRLRTTQRKAGRTRSSSAATSSGTPCPRASAPALPARSRRRLASRARPPGCTRRPRRRRPGASSRARTRAGSRKPSGGTLSDRSS